MPLDHIGLGQVADLQATRAFYEKALKPLGYEVRVRTTTSLFSRQRYINLVYLFATGFDSVDGLLSSCYWVWYQYILSRLLGIRQQRR